MCVGELSKGDEVYIQANYNNMFYNAFGGAESEIKNYNTDNPHMNPAILYVWASNGWLTTCELIRNTYGDDTSADANVRYSLTDEEGTEVTVYIMWTVRSSSTDDDPVTEEEETTSSPSASSEEEEDTTPSPSESPSGNENDTGDSNGNSNTETYPLGSHTDGNTTYTYYAKYCYYLIAGSKTTKTAQSQINATGSHEVIDVDAENGLGATAAGTPVELEMLGGNIDLRTSLGGTVWIDQDEQKDQNSGTLGVYDTTESPAAENSVEIIVYKVTYENGVETEREKAIAWDEEGNVIDFENTRVYIDANGEYEIPEIQVPSKEDKKESETIAYDIEFIYDGQTYEATEFLASASGDTISEKLQDFYKTAQETAGTNKDYTTYALNSYIVENADEREAFDSYFTEVYGDTDINTSDSSTTGKASGGTGGTYYSEEDRTNATSSETTLNYAGTTTDTMTTSDLITTDSDGYVLDQYKFAARTTETGLLYPYESQYHVEEDYYDNLTFQGVAYKPVDEYFNQINLGLLERYDADISVLKDLYTAKVIVNEQEQTYTYNSWAGLTNEELLQTVNDGFREKTYSIDLYNSDYYYRSSVYNTITDEVTKTVLTAIKSGTDLRMYVTYRIAITNNSVETDVSINEFKDYYDSNFTLVTSDVQMSILNNNEERETKTVAYAPYYRKLSSNADAASIYNYNITEDLAVTGIDGGVTGTNQTFTNSSGKTIANGSNDSTSTTMDTVCSTNSEFNESSSTMLSAWKSDGTLNTSMMLEPGETYEVFVTYEVDRDGYLAAVSDETTTNEDGSVTVNTSDRDLVGSQNNIAELSNYTTTYTEESVARHKTTSYKAGQISGRVDKDSAADNINLATTETDENGDKFVVDKYFEDDTKAAPTTYIQLKGATARSLDGVVWDDSREDGGEADGIYDSSTESGIADVDVTMVEKIYVTAEDLQTAVGSTNVNGYDLSLLDYEFEYIWPVGSYGDLNGDGEVNEDDFTSTLTTAEDGSYEFTNFTSGTYVVRFEYGNDTDVTNDLIYNGQDYKNTTYQTGMTNSEDTVNGDTPGQSTLNNEWQDLTDNEEAEALENTRVSDARDYEPRRVKVMAYSRTITNENGEVLAVANTVDGLEDVTGADLDASLTDDYKQVLEENLEEFVENTAMVANTAKINVEIEDPSGIAYKTVETTDGTVDHVYAISNIDFGLVERAETRINIKKEIAQIILTKNSGTEIVLRVTMDEDGNIDKIAEGTSSSTKVTEISKTELALGSQGFKYIAIEASYLNGMDLMLQYNITVTNNSETDYVSTRLASLKNIQAYYDLAANIETKVVNDLDEWNYGLCPYTTGKGIVYGQYVGLHYYTGTTEALVGDDDSITDEQKASLESKYGYDGYTDTVVTTTIDQLVDYIDNDITIDDDETTAVVDQSWEDSTDDDRTNKLSVMSYADNTQTDENLVDNKERSYVSSASDNISLSTNENIDVVTVTYNVVAVDENDLPKTEQADGYLVPKLETVTLENVYTANSSTSSGTISSYNPNLTKELLPGDTATISIVTSTTANEETINDMNYDNLVEVVMYSNTVGRRDMQTIPGNANLIAKENPAYKAGYQIDYSNDSEYVAQTVQVTDSNAESVTVSTERDAYAARDTITFSEPTGLSIEKESIQRIVTILLIGLIVAAITVIVITIIVVFKKTEYDDNDLLTPDNK